MQQHPQYTRNRIAQLVARIKRRIYPDTVDVAELDASEAVDRITYAEAQALSYRPARPGMQLGPEWATFWFRDQVQVPAGWAGSRVGLLWDSRNEATLRA
jgi:hypothetical protein